ncbi:MAG TPA: methyltransferase domain-containing protein [Stellaceae bacterium]|nr:methyltransferase domain-containing protein [Stellaceae bacterium]
MDAESVVAPAGLRARIQRYYGSDCRILAVRRAWREGAFLFVIDAMQRGRLVRTLGTIGRGGGSVMEQSAMDMGQPERLVFSYERAMLASLALVAEPRRALLLGLGGGAMARHLAAYMPALEVTLVERDPAVIACARRYFRLEPAVIEADAMAWVATARHGFDVVMVDLYDAAGAMAFPPRFWHECRAALRPGGAIAVNWAGTLRGGLPREEIERAMAQLPGSFLVVERGRRPNLVQLVSTVAQFQLPLLAAALREFAARHDLPREDRDVLRRCEVTARYPAGGGDGKL